jgi:hypothetical protein
MTTEPGDSHKYFKTINRPDCPQRPIGFDYCCDVGLRERRKYDLSTTLLLPHRSDPCKLTSDKSVRPIIIGADTTSGNPLVTGSHNLTARTAGVAAGMDRIAPDTVVRRWSLAQTSAACAAMRAAHLSAMV